MNNTMTHRLAACQTCPVINNPEWCRSCHAEAEMLQQQEAEIAKLDAIARAEEITQNGPYGPLTSPDNGDWYPACGGTEVPFNTRTGRRLLYCWQPSTGRHAYLDVGTDLILSDEEAQQALATS